MTLNKNRKAMTLIELVLSMTILAAIVSIAVISADDMGETNRYDETDRRGKLIQNALVGFDTPRFLQDMGRLPLTLVGIKDDNLYQATDRTNSNYETLIAYKKLFLAELIDLEADSSLTYSFKNALRMKKQECSIDIDLTNITSDSSDSTDEPDEADVPFDSVTIKAGWAGPYALSGSENMTDNWGKPWDIYHYSDDVDGYGTAGYKWATQFTTAESTPGTNYIDDTNDEIVLGTEIYGIRSIYNEDYASDLSYKFPENSAYADVAIKLCDKNGAPINTSGYDEIRVFLYLPYCAIKTTDEGADNSNEANYPIPKIMELCLWVNSSTDKEGLRIRYDINADNSVDSSYLTSTSEDSAYPTYLKARFNADKSSLTQVALDSVPVGSRKIWAYAIGGPSDPIFAPLQNIKITATNNTIELRLSESF
ncbi:MAG: prepilin-type N-terminal cleavage/methylation domain-containing protein [Opitutales bacterium]